MKTETNNGGNGNVKILLPEFPTPSERFAAEELQKFYEQATSVKLDIAADNDNAAADCFLSVGDTALFESSGIKLDKTELNGDGYIIQSTGGNVLMNAASESGKIYAVYGFLERKCGFKVYAVDEISVNQTGAIDFNDLHVVDVPDFQGRDFHHYSFIFDSLFATRMRLNGVRTEFESKYGEGSMWSKYYWVHSTFSILPPDKYYESHPEWYSENKTQLCFAKALEDSDSGREMFETFTKNFISRIDAEPTRKYFMIGQEDVGTTCTSPVSLAANKKYGGEHEAPSGTLIVFVNKVARAVKEHLLKTDKKRADVVKVVTFAYQRTEEPPVTFNEKTGKFESVPEVVPDDNVMIRFAPLASCYSFDFMNDTVNAKQRRALLGWSALGAKLCVWQYTIGFGAYMYPLYNLHTWGKNYRTYKSLGVNDLLDQSAHDTLSTPFYAMRNYIGSRLMWDTELSVKDLAEEFIGHYYKSVAPLVKQYLELLYAHFKFMEIARDFRAYAGGWESRDVAIVKYYPMEFLQAALNHFKKIREAVSLIGDEEERKLVDRRVRTEELSPRFMMIDLYHKFFDRDELIAELEAFKSDCAELGLELYKEGKRSSIESIVSRWRTELG